MRHVSKPKTDSVKTNWVKFKELDRKDKKALAFFVCGGALFMGTVLGALKIDKDYFDAQYGSIQGATSNSIGKARHHLIRIKHWDDPGKCVRDVGEAKKHLATVANSTVSDSVKSKAFTISQEFDASICDQKDKKQRAKALGSKISDLKETALQEDSNVKEGNEKLTSLNIKQTVFRLSSFLVGGLMILGIAVLGRRFDEPKQE